jgi:hypothetical protein
MSNETFTARKVYTPDELAEELHFLMNPVNQGKKFFYKRLANLYSYAFLTYKTDLVKFLESRFGTITLQDKEINIIIK